MPVPYLHQTNSFSQKVFPLRMLRLLDFQQQYTWNNNGGCQEENKK